MAVLAVLAELAGFDICFGDDDQKRKPSLSRRIGCGVIGNRQIYMCYV